MELLDPVPRVGHKEFAHGATLLAVEVDGLAPLCRIPIGDIVGRKLGEIVTVGPEVIVDHVEDHTQSGGVGAIDEAAKVVRLAIEPRRREQVHAIVAPAEPAGEFGDRHDLEHSDAQGGQLRQLFRRRRPGAFRRVGADVHLVQDLAFRFDAMPFAIGPDEARRVDELRRTVNA